MTELLFNPTLGPLNARPFALGRVFYVDQANGSNTNNGVDPATPFETITHALTRCTANRGDYIYVLNTLDGSEPAYPVAINIARVHVIGVGRYGPDPLQRINGGGNACFRIAANETEVAGFGFHTTGAAAEGIAAAAPYVAWIHHCHFAGSSCPDGLLSGIGQPGTQTPWWLIEDNVFNSPNGVGITGFCIWANLVCATIRRNYFTCCAGGASPCIYSGNVEIGPIVDNYFYCPISDGGIVGWAISLMGAGHEGGPITNNHATQTGDGTGNNPYRDTSSPGVIGAISHGWGMNYSGQAVIAPAAN